MDVTFENSIKSFVTKDLEHGKFYDVRFKDSTYKNVLLESAELDAVPTFTFEIVFMDPGLSKSYEQPCYITIKSGMSNWSVSRAGQHIPLFTMGTLEDSEKNDDKVNSPKHYNFGNIEVIDFIHQVVKNYPGHLAYSIGNVIKYVARAPFKNGLEDLKKAKWYLKDVIKHWEDKDND